MADIDEIMREYTTGEATLEETNAALQETKAYFSLDLEKNIISDEERAITFVGDTPDKALGFGLLDTGTGTLDKVFVKDGQLGNIVVNEVKADGSTNMAAYVYIGGKRYEVFGDRLGEVRPRQTVKRKKPPNKPNLRRRSDLAGQKVTQRTLAGDYRVTYDDFGYVVSAVRVGRENPVNGVQA